MELLGQSNEMQRGMSAQIEALYAQITELQSPTPAVFAAPNCSESNKQLLEISRDSASGTGIAGHAQ